MGTNFHNIQGRQPCHRICTSAVWNWGETHRLLVDNPPQVVAHHGLCSVRGLPLDLAASVAAMVILRWDGGCTRMMEGPR